MADGFPVTIPDDDGGEILVGFGLPGAVYVRTSPGGVLLDAGQRERLAQAIVAASWETGRVAVHYHWPAVCECTEPGYRWSGDLSRVTCEACKAARPVSDPAEPPLHYNEGITGMYWDNLGSVGDG